MASVSKGEDTAEIKEAGTDTSEEAKSFAPSLPQRNDIEKSMGPDVMFLPNPQDTSYSCSDVNGFVKMPYPLPKTEMNRKSIPSVLDLTSKIYPDRTAFWTTSGKQITYREYAIRVRKLSNWLVQLGVRERQYIWLFADNSVAWAVIHLAAIHVGAVPVGIYPKSSSEDLQIFTNETDPVMIFVDNSARSQLCNSMKDKFKQLKRICSIEKMNKRVLRTNQSELVDESLCLKITSGTLKRMAVNQCCAVSYTPGSSGPYKPVMLNHDNLIYSARLYTLMHNIEYGEKRDKSFKFSSDSTYAYATNLVMELYGSLVTAGCICFVEKNDAYMDTLLDNMREKNQFVFIAHPSTWTSIFQEFQSRQPEIKIENADERQLKFFCIGPCSLDEDIVQCLALRGVGVTNVYSMTECSGFVPLGYSSPRRGFVGQMTDAGICELSPFSDMIDVSTGVCLREISITGRHVFMGYLNHPTETSQVKRNSKLNGLVGSDDYVTVEDGYLKIVGRKSEKLALGNKFEEILYVLAEVAAPSDGSSNAVDPESLLKETCLKQCSYLAAFTIVCKFVESDEFSKLMGPIGNVRRHLIHQIVAKPDDKADGNKNIEVN